MPTGPGCHFERRRRPFGRETAFAAADDRFYEGDKRDTREEALKNIEEAVKLYLEPVEDDEDFAADSEVVELAV